MKKTKSKTQRRKGRKRGQRGPGKGVEEEDRFADENDTKENQEP